MTQPRPPRLRLHDEGDVDRTRISLERLNNLPAELQRSIAANSSAITSGALSTAATLTEVVSGLLLGLFVLIFFGFVAVGGSYYVQRLQLDSMVMLAGFAVGCLAVALLAINNLRDIGNDRASNKRTLAVRFGEKFGLLEIALCVLAPFVVIPLINWVPLLALPLVIILLRSVGRSKGAELNRCLAIAGALQWAFGILFVIGTLL